MGLQELYIEIDGNYKDIMERLVTETRVRKFVLLFLEDDSYKNFLKAMEEENVQEAFRAIHTLKGVCMNLGFQGMYFLVNDMTELLRGNALEEGKKRLPQLQEVYENHVRAIEKYRREEA